MNHNRTTCIHASILKFGLKIEDGCGYHLIIVLAPQCTQFFHYRINLITLLTHLIAPPFLTSGLGGGEWSASCPCHFTAEERVPSTHWIGDWVGPLVGLDAVEKRKIFHYQKLRQFEIGLLCFNFSNSKQKKRCA
jgi:hypothetical protein